MGHRRKATSALLGIDFTRTNVSRIPAVYTKRRNYSGYYWFTATESLVSFESLFEKTFLCFLDHTQSVVAVAAQPMKIEFEDGKAHFPDYFAIHRDGTHVLYDVRPEARVEKSRQQFEATQKICDRVGWRYEMFTGYDQDEWNNLQFIAGNKHPRNCPTPPDKERLLEIFSQPRPLGEGCLMFNIKHPVLARAPLYHLLWKRELSFDHSQPLTSSSIIFREESNA